MKPKKRKKVKKRKPKQIKLKLYDEQNLMSLKAENLSLWNDVEEMKVALKKSEWAQLATRWEFN